MNNKTFYLSLFFILIIILIFALNFRAIISRESDSCNYNHLLEIIQVQNKTIYALEHAIDYSHLHNDINKNDKRTQISDNRQSSLTTLTAEPQSDFQRSLIRIKSNHETECEARYGLMDLVNIWTSHKEIWCSGSGDIHIHGGIPYKAEITCYPYHQMHKRRDGRGQDMYCEATNIFLDFTKIHGESFHKKPPIHQQYLRFDRGSIFSTCRKTRFYNPNIFMPHHALQMSSFVDNSVSPKEGTFDVVDNPTYLLARDEDCENSFHSTADFMNMFLVMNSLNLNSSAMRVVLFDNHLDGPYTDLIKAAYSPNFPISRISDFGHRKVLFKRLVFHLESPAALIFPKVANPDPLKCHSTSLFQEYRKYILQSFHLLDVHPPAIPSVTLSLRNRTPQKNVGRVLANEQEVVNVLKEGNMMNFQVIDGGAMSFRKQLEIIRSTNILVGVHGAGLMNIMFAADEAILIEVHPSYRQDRHFRHAARMTGKIYMPIRSRERESCQGSSDNVRIPIDEFRRTLDGALRIARSFDDGVSECGLVCPSEILAMDSRLDKFYKTSERKGTPVNTQFPC